MNGIDILLIGLLVAAVGAAVFWLIRRKRKGSSCCQNCSSCPGCSQKRK
ncbi:MAG: FeoB-associated Cys-rich membrane protein [Clostridia bacterium]|nr:FeoB-associated Cys-rich membrane protein [Clostridia bacterium]